MTTPFIRESNLARSSTPSLGRRPMSCDSSTGGATISVRRPPLPPPGGDLQSFRLLGRQLDTLAFVARTINRHSGVFDGCTLAVTGTGGPVQNRSRILTRLANTLGGKNICELYDVLYYVFGGSLYLCTTRRPLFYFSNSELGPCYGVSSDHPIYYVLVLAKLVFLTYPPDERVGVELADRLPRGPRQHPVTGVDGHDGLRDGPEGGGVGEAAHRVDIPIHLVHRHGLSNVVARAPALERPQERPRGAHLHTAVGSTVRGQKGTGKRDERPLVSATFERRRQRDGRNGAALARF
eukprot:1194638-Prorocentrum_minimum.AAC.2